MFVWIIPECSGCLAIDSKALPPIWPIPIPAPIADKPAPIAAKALTELKNHVADLSIEMAEKVLRSELSDTEKQRELVNRALKENNN